MFGVNESQEIHFMFFWYRDFLPRGSGIVTRRPLILQLVPDKSGSFDFLSIFLKPEILFQFQQVNGGLICCRFCRIW